MSDHRTTPWGALRAVFAMAVMVVGVVAFLSWLVGCTTLTITAPKDVLVICHRPAPGHWRVVVDGTERFRIDFPGPVPKVLPCPPL